MALITLFSDHILKYAVEEDAEGILWFSIDCAGIGYPEIHRRLTPGEGRQFRADNRSLQTRVRAILLNPRDHIRSEEEVAYRRKQNV